MISEIEYENKESLLNDEDIPNKNKVTAEDMNEIKQVVNNNATELEGKVSKTDKATQTEAETGTDNDKYMTPKTTKQAIDKKLENYTPSGGNVAYLDSLPVGSIILWFSDVIPDGFYSLNGQAISREYTKVFEMFGTKYGAGDGSTTFNLPDFSGLAPVGKDTSDTDFNELGKIVGSKEHTLTIEEIPSHTHDIKTTDNLYVQISHDVQAGGSNGKMGKGNEKGIVATNTGGGQAHNNVQPSIATNFIIKVKQIKVVPNITELEMLPIGTILSFEGTDVPTGWEAVEEKRDTVELEIPTFGTNGISVETGITDIKSIVNIYGGFVRPESPNRLYPILNCYMGEMYIEKDTKNLFLSTSSEYVTFKGNITIEYKKNEEVVSNEN